jgi:hypothetical protein
MMVLLSRVERALNYSRALLKNCGTYLKLYFWKSSARMRAARLPWSPMRRAALLHAACSLLEYDRQDGSSVVPNSEGVRD